MEAVYSFKSMMGRSVYEAMRAQIPENLYLHGYLQFMALACNGTAHRHFTVRFFHISFSFSSSYSFSFLPPCFKHYVRDRANIYITLHTKSVYCVQNIFVASPLDTDGSRDVTIRKLTKL
jgi:hypothetical protein